MRDPEGSLSFQPETVTRELRSESSASACFLRSPLARAMVRAGQLVPFEFRSERIVESPRLPFVSFPFEWSDAQLRAAGRLTLDLAKQALPDHHELKDASAWNVIFDGTSPVFCDHLSFQPIVRPHWWAFGQFVRHFVFPLAVSKVRSMRSHQTFALHRDGLPSDQARQLLGLRRFQSRLWPLLIKSSPNEGEARAAIGDGTPQIAKFFHPHLYAYCESLLHQKPRAASSAWSGYTGTRTHYQGGASQLKTECVDRWIAHSRPGWVTDLGCNTGEFSRLAAAHNAQVISVDYDHDCIEDLFLHPGAQSRIHPLIANLGDLPGGRGWSGAEFPGLAERLDKRCDMLLMLALIHHLVISEGIPLREVAKLAGQLTRRHAVVELVGHADPMVLRLSAQHSKPASAFTIEAQVAAFAERFDVLERVELPESQRVLLLLQVKS